MRVVIRWDPKGSSGRIKTSRLGALIHNREGGSFFRLGDGPKETAELGTYKDVEKHHPLS